ncbi:hypothetical protein SAMN05446635_5660 [Burkholderia sp. OK233]|nr:hypothetical protein SAMN05446635_5660 [Burkholderia sp. OK233]
MLAGPLARLQSTRRQKAQYKTGGEFSENRFRGPACERQMSTLKRLQMRHQPTASQTFRS